MVLPKADFVNADDRSCELVGRHVPTTTGRHHIKLGLRHCSPARACLVERSQSSAIHAGVHRRDPGLFPVPTSLYPQRVNDRPMWPWGHAAIGYLAYLGWTLLRHRDWPSRTGVLTVLVATQIPDLIDKPLAWTFHVLPSGRSLGHSLLFAVPLLLVGTLSLERLDRAELRTPVVIGYLSAILTDVPGAAYRGHVHDATFLLWPILPSPEYDIEPTFAAHLAQFQPSLPSVTELFIASITILSLAYNLARRSAT